MEDPARAPPPKQSRDRSTARDTLIVLGIVALCVCAGLGFSRPNKFARPVRGGTLVLRA